MTTEQINPIGITTEEKSTLKREKVLWYLQPALWLTFLLLVIYRTRTMAHFWPCFFYALASIITVGVIGYSLWRIFRRKESKTNEN